MRRLAPLTLLLVTAIWGWTFVLVKEGMTLTGPFTFLAGRFTLAFCLLSVLFRHSIRQIRVKALVYGSLIGIALFCGYLFQTWGLVYTTAAKSGLITGLAVVIVPVLSFILFKERLGKVIWGGIFLALLGLVLLILGKGRLTAINFGDLLTLVCTVGFAIHLLFIDRFVRSVDYRHLLVVQVGTVTLLSIVGTVLFETLPEAYPFALLQSVLITGLAATALALYVLNRFQIHSTAAYTAIILTMEPVFAGLFGFLLLGESLSKEQILGGVLIVAGMILPQVKREFFRHRAPSD